MHEHEYDADGRLVRTTVTHEPEWNDQQRDRLIALGIHDSQIGPCGFHHSLTNDRENHFSFREDTCNVCRAIARYGRMQAKADREAMKQYGEPSDWPAEAPRPSDGRLTSIYLMNPLEVQAMRQARKGEAQ